MEKLEWADVDLDGREEGFLSSRRDPGVLAQSVDRRRGEGVGGGCSLLQSLALRLSTERWGEGTHGGLEPYDSPRPGCGVSLRGHLVQSGPPLPQSCRRSDLRLKRTSSGDFQLYFAESPSPSRIPMGSYSGREARSPSFLPSFPFLSRYTGMAVRFPGRGKGEVF